MEVVDAVGRPSELAGEIVDEDNRVVARIATSHQGRGVFTIRPEVGRRYSLVAGNGRFDLPPAHDQGLTLNSSGFAGKPGENLKLEVVNTQDEAFVVGAFCRGALVASDTLFGRGRHDVNLSLPKSIAGVLRVTVFDAQLNPRAERLVHRLPSQEINITLEQTGDNLIPGETQEISLRTTDENGRPVAAIVGLTVTDKAVRDIVDKRRIGLADATWLTADLEELEDLEDFLDDTKAARNVDLLLGTRGWRRFIWQKPDEAVEAKGDEARRALAQEGRSQIPAIAEVVAIDTASMSQYCEAASNWEDGASLAAFLAILILYFGVLGRVGWNSSIKKENPDQENHVAATVKTMFMAILPLILLVVVLDGLSSSNSASDGDSMFLARRPMHRAAIADKRLFEDQEPVEPNLAERVFDKLGTVHRPDSD